MSKTWEERVERIEELLAHLYQDSNGYIASNTHIRGILHEIALERKEIEHHRERRR
jgi:hypothetical protein